MKTRLRSMRLALICVVACGCLGITLLGVLFAPASPAGRTVARNSSVALSGRTEHPAG